MQGVGCRDSPQTSSSSGDTEGRILSHTEFLMSTKNPSALVVRVGVCIPSKEKRTISRTISHPHGLFFCCGCLPTWLTVLCNGHFKLLTKGAAQSHRCDYPGIGHRQHVPPTQLMSVVSETVNHPGDSASVEARTPPLPTESVPAALGMDLRMPLTWQMMSEDPAGSACVLRALSHVASFHFDKTVRCNREKLHHFAPEA